MIYCLNEEVAISDILRYEVNASESAALLSIGKVTKAGNGNRSADSIYGAMLPTYSEI